MRRAHAASLPVIVVTGRMVKSVRQALEPAGVAAPVIGYQGAVVADEHGRWLRHEPIPLELAREIVAALADEGHSPNVYVDDELYVADRYAERARVCGLRTGSTSTLLARCSTGSTSRRRSSCASATRPRSTRSSRG